MPNDWPNPCKENHARLQGDVGETSIPIGRPLRFRRMSPRRQAVPPRSVLPGKKGVQGKETVGFRSPGGCGRQSPSPSPTPNDEASAYNSQGCHQQNHFFSALRACIFPVLYRCSDPDQRPRLPRRASAEFKLCTTVVQVAYNQEIPHRTVGARRRLVQRLRLVHHLRNGRVPEDGPDKGHEAVRNLIMTNRPKMCLLRILGTAPARGARAVSSILVDCLPVSSNPRHLPLVCNPAHAHFSVHSCCSRVTMSAKHKPCSRSKARFPTRW